jgi:DNA polymerase III alpha subunit (gram-positive type)
MKRLKALIKTLIRYEKKAEEITGKDLDKLVADRIKRELNDGA